MDLLVILKDTASDLMHVHFANPVGRIFPVSMDVDNYYTGFFHAHKEINYHSRISVETYSTGLERDAKRVLLFIRKIFNTTYYPV